MDYTNSIHSQINDEYLSKLNEEQLLKLLENDDLDRNEQIFIIGHFSSFYDYIRLFESDTIHLNPSIAKDLIKSLYSEKLDENESTLLKQALKKYFFNINDRMLKQIISDGEIFEENELQQYIKSEKTELFDKLLLAKDNTEMIKDIFIQAGYQEKIAQRFLNLYTINKHLITTINLDILDNDMLYQNLENKMDVITCFPEIQQMILALDDLKLEIFIRCIKDYENQIDEWKPITEKLLINLSSNKFNDLVENIKITDLEDIDITKLISILSLEENYFNISNWEEFRDFDNLRKTICDSIIENPNGTKLANYPYINLMDSKQKILFATLQKLYGFEVSSLDAISRYKSIEQMKEKNIPIFTIIETLQKLEKLDEKTLTLIYQQSEFSQNNYLTQYALDALTRQEYAKTYREELYIPKQQDRLYPPEDNPNLYKYTDKDGKEKNISVYDAGTDFLMMVSSLGGIFGKRKEADSVYDDFNRREIVSQHICCSPISEKHRVHCPVNLVLLGFTNFVDSQLLFSSYGDIVSEGDSFNSLADIEHLTFAMPNDLIELANTKDSLTEMNYLRFYNGKRTQPSYIIFHTDVMGECSDENYLWLNAKQAAAEWDIPIVIIDEEKLQKSAQEVSKKVTIKDIEEINTGVSNEQRQIALLNLSQIMHNSQIIDENFGKFQQEQSSAKKKISIRIKPNNTER